MQTISPELFDKPIFQMTGGELLQLFGAVAESKTITKDFTEKKYVHGLSGLANLLKCSKTTAQAIKNSGKIDDAVYQTGKTIVIDADKALELIKKKSI